MTKKEALIRLEQIQHELVEIIKVLNQPSIPLNNIPDMIGGHN